MASPLAPDDLDDVELLRRSRRDPEAFAVFYDRHVDMILGFFMRRTADPEVAADLTSETFAAALAGVWRFRFTGAPPSAWLVGIARNLLRRYLRTAVVATRARRKLAMTTDVDLDDEACARIEALVDAEALVDDLQDALDGLSDKVASAVTLRVVDELPYAEVADRLGCSERAARVRVHRGLTRLADQLRPAADPDAAEAHP